MTTINRGAAVRVGDGASLVGVGLVALGGLLLLDRLGVELAGIPLASLWPLIPIAFGLRWLWRRQTLAGLLFTVGGALFLAATTGAFQADAGAIVVPSALVLAGIVMLFGSRRGRQLSIPVDSTDAALALFSSRRWTAAAGELAGANLVSVLGDVDVTLTDDERPTEPVAVSAVTVLGETELVVPSGWRVTSGVVALLGDLTLPVDQPTDPAAPELRLSGVVVLGDCKVRRA